MAKDDEQQAAPKKGFPIKFAIMGGILLLFLGLEVLIATFFVNKLKDTENPELAKVQEQQEKEKAEAAKHTQMGVTMDKAIEVTVNVAGTEGERFLKSAVQLEWSSQDPLVGPEVMARLPKIKNIIIDILSSKQMSEIITTDGKKALRDAIVADINAILPAEVVNEKGESTPVGKVERAFFVEFIIQ